MHRLIVLLTLTPLLSLLSLSTACPPSTGEGEGEGEGAAEGEGAGAGEGEGAGAGEGEGEGEAGEGEGEGTPCGDVRRDQQCDGNVVEFCDPDSNSLVTFDCGAAPYTGATCGTVNGSWGDDCIEDAGAACFFLDADDPSQSVVAACGTTGNCTITGAATSVCGTDNPISCGNGDLGVCTGDVYSFGCNFLGAQSATDGQPLLADCAALGGTCVADVNQVRGGCFVASGQPCAPFFTHCGTGPTDPNEADCPASGTCP